MFCSIIIWSSLTPVSKKILLLFTQYLFLSWWNLFRFSHIFTQLRITISFIFLFKLFLHLSFYLFHGFIKRSLINLSLLWRNGVIDITAEHTFILTVILSWLGSVHCDNFGWFLLQQHFYNTPVLLTGFSHFVFLFEFVSFSYPTAKNYR